MVMRCTRVLLATGRPLAADGVAEREVFDISQRVNRDLLSWDSKDGLGRFSFPPASIKNGSDVNACEMKLSVRTGTHVPSHTFDNYSNAGFDAESLDLLRSYFVS